jgi:hypothetical protein
MSEPAPDNNATGGEQTAGGKKATGAEEVTTSGEAAATNSHASRPCNNCRDKKKGCDKALPRCRFCVEYKG